MHRQHLRRYITSDGAIHFYRVWTADPSLPFRGRVIALHGIQSHSGWYAGTARALAGAGFEVCWLDRRGSGMNEAQRGHAPHAERLLNDVVQFRTHLERLDPHPTPTVLLAVSWGAKIATALVAHRPAPSPARWAGLALLYPGLFPKIGPRLDQRVRLSLARGLGILKRPVRVPLEDPALFTRDPVWQAYIRRDPLALHTVTSGLLLAGQDLDRLVATNSGRITLPCLLMLAGDDPIIDNRQTLSWFDTLASTQKTQHTYPAARHTLEFEPEFLDVARDLVHWAVQVTAAMSVTAPATTAICRPLPG
jgi:acylglycerol lipase